MKPGREGSGRRLGTAALFYGRNRLWFGLGTAPAQAARPGKVAALLGVSGRHYRVVSRQVPFGPVLVRRHGVGCAQVTLEHFQLPAVLQADDVLGRDRSADWNGRLLDLLLLLLHRLKELQERSMNGADHACDIGSRQGVAAQVGGGDPSGQGDDFFGKGGGVAVIHRAFSGCRVRRWAGAVAEIGPRPGCGTLPRRDCGWPVLLCPSRSGFATSAIPTVL